MKQSDNKANRKLLEQKPQQVRKTKVEEEITKKRKTL
jgi:hypothetical protein